MRYHYHRSRMKYAPLLFLLLLLVSFRPPASLFVVKSSTVQFRSEAPLETIVAANKAMNGLLDLATNNFAFKVPVSAFAGFNTDLQRDHFNENYMEADKFDDVQFQGKIVDDVDLNTDGSHRVKVKGAMTIHGVKSDLIITGTIARKGKSISIHADFDVVLANFSIDIPRVVMQKIAPVIKVTVDATLEPK